MEVREAQEGSHEWRSEWWGIQVSQHIEIFSFESVTSLEKLIFEIIDPVFWACVVDSTLLVAHPVTTARAEIADSHWATVLIWNILSLLESTWGYSHWSLSEWCCHIGRLLCSAFDDSLRGLNVRLELFIWRSRSWVWDIDVAGGLIHASFRRLLSQWWATIHLCDALSFRALASHPTVSAV